VKKYIPAKTQSQILPRLMAEYNQLLSNTEKQQWLSNLQTPVIETMDDDPDYCRVTFLFQRIADEEATIYLYSPTTGFPCSPVSMLVNYPGTDIDYLTLLLPANLRMSYSFLIIAREYHYEEDNTALPPIYPLPMGELARSLWLFNQLMADNAVGIDSYNLHSIIYYKDWENPIEFWARESILELPKAPAALISVKNNLEKLYQEKRLFRTILQFNDTSLSTYPGYQDTERKYWVYLPPHYDASKTYPLMLFLDGSDYLGLFLTPSILDTLIVNRDIPPCVAIFFDYSSDHRMVEYNCSAAFTDFIAEELFLIIKQQYGLLIDDSPQLTTIVGYSASGLAAFYTGVSHPDRFGQVIAQSPSLEILKKSELHDLITRNPSHHTRFFLESGSLETLPAELKFADGSSQAFNSLQACREAAEELEHQGWSVHFDEFMGGHNTICWSNSLPAKIKAAFSASR
jgi:enterochelin esterase-like enzyme